MPRRHRSRNARGLSPPPRRESRRGLDRQHLLDRVGQAPWVTRWDQQAGAPVLDEFVDAADRGRHEGHLRGAAFEHEQRRPLPIRGQSPDVDLAEDPVDVVATAEQVDRGLDAEPADLALELGAARAVTGDHEVHVGESRDQHRVSVEHHLERLLLAHHSGDADHLRIRCELEVAPDVAVGRTEMRDVAGRNHPDLLRPNALERDHALAVGLGDRDEAGGEPADHVPVQPHAQTVAGVGPVVLVRDDDRNSAGPAGDAGPYVRAEHVGVHDVESVAPEHRHQRKEPVHIPFGPTTETDVADAGVDQRPHRQLVAAAGAATSTVRSGRAACGSRGRWRSARRRRRRPRG